MKQKRYPNKQRNQAHPALLAESVLSAVGQESPSQRAVAQCRPATAVSAAAMARAVQTSPSYFSPVLSRWSARWGGTFCDLIAVVERFRSIPSLAALDVSISRQLNLETDGTSPGLEGR